MGPINPEETTPRCGHLSGTGTEEHQPRTSGNVLLPSAETRQAIIPTEHRAARTFLLPDDTRPDFDVDLELEGTSEMFVRLRRDDASQFLRLNSQSLRDFGLAPFEWHDQSAEVGGIRTQLPTVVTFGSEWCGSMWKLAAQSVITLWRELVSLGYTLLVPRSNGVQFEGTTPVLYFHGQIVPYSSDAFCRASSTFFAEFIAPLASISTGRGEMARTLLRRLGRDFLAEASGVAHLRRRFQFGGGDSDPRLYLEEISRRIVDLAVDDRDTFWTGYFPPDLSLEPTSDWGYKQHVAANLFAALEAKQVLDIGANLGWYSRLAAAHGARVTALDSDEICVNRLFRRATLERCTILPLVMDVLDPTPSLGVCNYRPGALERLRSQMVIALAICHHLVLGSGLTFDNVGMLFSKLSDKWVITEFVSFDKRSCNPYTPDVRPGCEHWYTLDNFISALRRHFCDVAVAPGAPGGRTILVCEK